MRNLNRYIWWFYYSVNSIPQGWKLRFPGPQCDKKFCTGDQNFTAGCHIFPFGDWKKRSVASWRLPKKVNFRPWNTFIHLGGESHCESNTYYTCLARKQKNIPSKVRAQTTQSVVERTNNEATVSPKLCLAAQKCEESVHPLVARKCHCFLYWSEMQ